jgi:tRNA (Thr-GGU) A37 N-methylase
LIKIEGLVLHVEGIDLLDKTPVLDIKPYVSYCDAFPDAKCGYVDQIEETSQHEIDVFGKTNPR